MKYKIICFLFLLGTILTYGQNNKSYKDLLEPNATLMESGANYSIEKVNSKQYIYKVYFTGNKQITHFATYNSKKLRVLHGDFRRCFDDGTVFQKGRYEHGEKVGEWIENGNQTGSYKKGIKDGTWITKGAPKYMPIADSGVDSIQYEEVYEMGVLISSTQDTTATAALVMPRFLGCEDLLGSAEDKKVCADQKMLTFIYQHIKYPKRARLKNIEGMAIIRFVVEKDGTIQELNVLQGITKEISKECIRVINKMPAWIPGKVNGEPVRVQFYLPIRFRLE